MVFVSIGELLCEAAAIGLCTKRATKQKVKQLAISISKTLSKGQEAVHPAAL